MVPTLYYVFPNFQRSMVQTIIYFLPIVDNVISCENFDTRAKNVWFKLQFDLVLILLAFITRNSSLEPLLEGLFALIHINLSWRGNITWKLYMLN